MTTDQKNRIAELRKGGMGYLKIAQTLGLNENSVKTFCRRNGLTGDVKEMPKTVFPGVVQKTCKNCGDLFLQYPGHREKLFCCDACRNKWWNSHLPQVTRKAMYGGPASSSDFVFSYIRNTLELQHIDYVISTHPHLDHVYGLSAVLNAAPVDLILTPVLEWNSKAFENVLKYAEKQGAPLSVPQEGDTLQLGGATVTILHCWPEVIDYGRTNDSSIVTRIDYGQTSFIITGDAEDWSEYMMIDSSLNLKANVLRISHHGSNSGSTLQFLQAVQPDCAVISVGKDNGYGHPHQEVLDRLAEVSAVVLRTDELGTIVMESDGTSVSLK